MREYVRESWVRECCRLSEGGGNWDGVRRG